MHQACLPAGYRLEPCADLPRALDRIWKEGLAENDEETSHVLELADPRRNPSRTGITHAWLVVHEASGQDAGMAILSPPTADTCGRRELNVYVHHQHRARGLGACLLQAVLAEDPAAAGFYSNSSVKLYAAHRVASAWPVPVHPDRTRITPQELPEHLGPDNLTANQRAHVQLILEERASYDALDQARQSRPSPRP